MKQISQKHYLLGEVIESSSHIFEIADLHTGQSYPHSSHNTLLKLSKGQILQFVLVNNIPTAITELAAGNSAKALLYKISAKKKLMPFFSPAIQQEVDKIIGNTGIDDLSLVDLESLAFCTIDGADTMDLDQALQVEKTENGFIVRYAIADATYYIKPGSALFDEALKRGTSFYLPGLMIPMLPRELCVDVISLNENVSRRAIVFEIFLNHQGTHNKTNIIRARIKSCGKLSFKEVEHFLANPLIPIRNNQALSLSLKYFKEVGLQRLQLAEERNVARFHRTEVNIKLGAKGLVFNLLDNVRNEVESYNEQFSLLCNIAGAKLLNEKDTSLAKFIQPIFKVHPAPSEEKITAFRVAIRQLIKLHSLDSKLWYWHDDKTQSLSEYLRCLPQTGTVKRVAQAIHRQALLMNTRSSFSEQPGRHFGVGADVYARFSAPMREIVGVFLHKELMEKIVGCDSSCLEQPDEQLRQQIIQASNRAKNIQRQLTNEANLLVLDQVFKTDLSCSKENIPIRKGTVIGLGRDKLYILLDDISIEIKLYIRPLEILWEKNLLIDQKRLSLINKDNQEGLINLGDEVDIAVFDKDHSKHRWFFSIERSDIKD